MWYKIGAFLLKYRLTVLIMLVLFTAFMTYKASQAKINYEFSKAIPVTNSKYIDYENFKRNSAMMALRWFWACRLILFIPRKTLMPYYN